MSGGKLEVQIGADKTDFDKKIKEIEYDIKELSKVKLDRLKVGLDTTEINSQIKDAKNNLNQLKSTVKDTGQTFSGMAPKVANGGNALMQFSRIAQDAPFGIIGIGNNITATVESFGYLKNATGSTGGALKALGQSIMGSGGILLGVSLLTTGLTYLAQSGLSVGDIIDKITGNFDEAKNSIQKMNSEAIKSSGSEVAELKALVSASSNVNLSMKDRLLAVNKLQETYPAYFGNLSKEQILNGQVTEATNKLTTAIIEKAKAQAYANRIGENEAKIYDLQQKGQKLVTEFSKGGGVFAILGGQNGGALFKKQAQSIANDIDALKKENEALAKSIKTSTNAGLGLLADPIKTPKVKKVKDKTHASFDPTFIAPFVSTISGLGDTMAGFEERTRIAFANASGTVKAETDKMTLDLKTFNDNASAIITNSIANTFIGLGEAIGSALATGSDILSAVGASLLSSLGNILTDMGKMAIQVGVGLLAIKTALKSLNPAVAIGAGVALIALGSFFSAKSSAIGGGIGGGASGSSGAGANNSSFTSSGFASNSGGGTVVFEIAGTKLIGVLSNTINSNKRLGGQLGLG